MIECANAIFAAYFEEPRVRSLAQKKTEIPARGDWVRERNMFVYFEAFSFTKFAQNKAKKRTKIHARLAIASPNAIRICCLFWATI